MTNNDILRGIRFLLDVSDEGLANVTSLTGFKVAASEMASYLAHEESPNFRECPDGVMAHVLNGMVLFKRGVDPARPAQPLDLPMSNNAVLKKLRVAFELKDTDLIELVESSGVLKVSKAEMGSFCRASDHRNFRPFGDQYLRNLMRALATKIGRT